MYNEDLLANAIIKQAADDYQKALIAHKKSAKMIKDCREFFTGEWYKELTNVDGEMLMKMLEKEVVEYNYSMEAIIKSRTKAGNGV